MPSRHLLRVTAVWLALPLLAGILCPAVHAADKDKDDKKEKQKEEKKVKEEPWVEVRTTYFVVASDGGERTARHVAEQFEQVRRVFQATMPNARFNTGFPVQILAARNADSFAKLFPEYPSDKKRPQPPGLFVPGQEKIYIGLRVNASGPQPYNEIYQEYARLVLKLSYRNLPPWLEEGYSNVFGSLTLTEKGAKLGHPDPEDMSVLYESPLLPLDLVFHVDRNSGYYRVGERNTVYFAESRAMVHFLLTDPQMTGMKALDQYVAKVEAGADALESARQVFGDLSQLQNKLQAYIQQTKAPPVDVAIAGGDSGGSSKTLSVAEADARMGDFSMHRGKRGDAEDKLDDALNADSSVAEAEQTMGFLKLQQGQLEDADQHLARAVEIDPNDALSYYGLGEVAMARGGYVGVPVGAVTAFEKAVAINADFAPAWFNLATIYAERTETLQKALADAQHAASLAPGESGYQLQVAAILERMGRNEEARKTATQVQASTSDPKMANKAGELVAQTSQPQTSASAAPVSRPPGTVAPVGSSRIERKTEPEQPAAAPTPRTQPNPPPPPAAANTRLYSMVGTISDVSCANSPQIQITLKAQTIVMHLHAGDLGQVAIKSSGSDAPAKNTTCASLRGRSARVSYVLVSDQKWDGEIQIVEFR